MSLSISIAPYGTSTYTNITPLIANKGVTWTFNSVDADGAGRSLDGIMHRKQIAIKNKLEIKCRPMTSTEIQTLKNLLANEWLSVRIVDDAETVTFKGYRGATLSTAILVSHTAVQKWDGMKFSLIEE